MDLLPTAAWWGAVSGSIAIAWDFVKWSRSGVRLQISVTPYMQIVTPGKGVGDQLWVNIEVRNVGGKATTVTHVSGAVYPGTVSRLRRKPSVQFVLTPGFDKDGIGFSVPHRIEPGDRWQAVVPQSSVIEMAAKGPVLYLGISHSMSRRMATSRVSFKPETGD